MGHPDDTEAAPKRKGNELRADPARSENLFRYGIFMRENREIPRPLARTIIRVGRSGKAKAARLRCTVVGGRTVPQYRRSRRTRPRER